MLTSRPKTLTLPYEDDDLSLRDDQNGTFVRNLEEPAT